VFFENKVDLVLLHIPSNLIIPHVFKLFFFILPWNRRVDNFIKSVAVFVDRFLFGKRVVIIMHVNDLQVLKEIRSFLESYQLKVHMKWIVVNSSPHMNSEDPSS
jgi:hypothetical protein